jgi:chromosome segregation ATPase
MSFGQVGGGSSKGVDNDVAQFERRLVQIRESKDKLKTPAIRKTVKRTLGEMDTLADGLRSKIPTADPALRDKFQRAYQEYQQLRGPISSSIGSFEAEERASAPAGQSSGGSQLHQSLLSPEQLQAQHDADELAYLQAESENIVETMQTINAMSHELDDKITEQHETLVQIDNTIVEAKEDMVKGNENLVVAEEHQKESGKCMIWILIAVVAGVVVLGLIIGLTV